MDLAEVNDLERITASIHMFRAVTEDRLHWEVPNGPAFPEQGNDS